jgi:type 1 glutamine amidotransferase
MSKKALIVYGGWPGHSPKETSEILAKALRNSGFDVELSDTQDSFLDTKRVMTFDLIVPNWTMGDLPGEKEKVLLDAVQNGVGIAGFHGGMGDSFRPNTGYQFMVGGQFVAHPDNQKDYVVNLVKTSDPIVAGLSDFKVHSEQYYMHVDPANEVLATTIFQTKDAPWVNGTVMPVVWKKPYGQGRVFYQSVGHGPADFDIPEVLEITRRGCVWAAR